ncbi:MAG: GDSL-type esterase/lipase family protein [Flavobacteriaceae bacterium]
MRTVLIFLLLIISCSPLKKYENTAAKWEKDISKLESQDQSEKYTENAILFIGSSSIRAWNSMEKDMFPYETIKRGYGGAHYSDIIHFTKRLVKNHSPKAILIFVANDIKGNNKSDIYSKNLTDRTPNEVKRLFKLVIDQIRSVHKEIPIFGIETTPTKSRWKAWPKISLANDLIKEYCESKDNLYYISTRNHYIGKNGLPTEELFIRDKLHLNRKGYALWGEIIKKNLKKIVNYN